MKYKSWQSGFTLLELLIALTLLSMVLVILYSGLHFGMRSWDSGEARAEANNKVRVVHEFIRRHLRQAVDVYRNDSSDGRVIYFTGESDHIGWVAPMLEYLGLGGLYYIQLDRVVDQGTDDGILRIRWYPYRLDNETDVIDSADAKETLLLSGVETFKLEYFGAEEPDDEPQWQDSWPSKLFRPSLVRLKIELADASWPDLTVAVAN